jgi:hypothetical protein
VNIRFDCPNRPFEGFGDIGVRKADDVAKNQSGSHRSRQSLKPRLPRGRSGKTRKAPVDWSTMFREVELVALSDDWIPPILLRPPGMLR